MPPGVPRDRVRAVEAAFLKTLKDPEFVAEAEKTRMTLNPIPGTILHNMIVEDVSMSRRPQRKAQTDPCAEGLAGERVAISESLASWDYR
jgi:hypothetical protein